MAPELTALRCLFLVASHHGASLAPEQLPATTSADMVPPVLDATRRVGLRARVLCGCRWGKAAALGTAFLRWLFAATGAG